MAGREVFFARVEALIAAMLEGEGVRLPGTRRYGLARKASRWGGDSGDRPGVAARLAGPRGTAATAAAVKKQELEQGKKNMEQMQQKIGRAMQQVEQSAQRRNEAPVQ